MSLNQTNKCTRLLVSIRYIFNPYICFGKWIAIFRGYVSDSYKYYLQIALVVLLYKNPLKMAIHSPKHKKGLTMYLILTNNLVHLLV